MRCLGFEKKLSSLFYIIFFFISSCLQCAFMTACVRVCNSCQNKIKKHGIYVHVPIKTIMHLHTLAVGESGGQRKAQSM